MLILVLSKEQNIHWYDPNGSLSKREHQILKKFESGQKITDGIKLAFMAIVERYKNTTFKTAEETVSKDKKGPKPLDYIAYERVEDILQYFSSRGK